MLTDLKTILAMADEKNVAVPAFNVYNVEGAIGVLMAARETHAPVIFQMYTRLVDNYHADFVAPAILIWITAPVSARSFAPCARA